jgi:release factor glutamine methyltransferase
MSDSPQNKGSKSAASDDPWTVLRLLEWTTDFFKTRGSESARLDAEVLLAHARDCSRIELYTSFGEVPTDEQRIAFREMVRRRGEGMPVAQLVGYREFYSLRFRVDENVLIPRPETEHLVIEALDRAKALKITDRPIQIADIGTGSGAIAVAIAKHAKNVAVTAVDRSTAALEIALWNAEKHNVSSTVRFLESDLLSAVTTPQQFDIICSNPPYVSELEFAKLPITVRNFEPKQALVSGAEGTEVIERLLKECPDRLQPGGRLIIELSPMIASACERLANASSAFTDLKFIKDLEGHSRILSLQRV